MNTPKNIGCVIAYRPRHTNYGTALVGYALLHMLRNMGHRVELIIYEKRLSTAQKFRFIWNAVRCGNLGELFGRVGGYMSLHSKAEYAASIQKRVDAVECFQKVYLFPYFHTYAGYDALHEGAKNYDCVVVGSDQVWTPLSLPNRYFNLLFVPDNVRKVAYGSSFGVSNIPVFQRMATGEYLNRFYKIGVREEQGKLIVESLSQKEAQVVADPTLLLSSHEWNDIMRDRHLPLNEPYIFCYFLGTNPECRKAANVLKQRTNMKIVALRHMDEYYAPDETFGDIAPYNVDPLDFVNLIRNADYVLTDSFHCTAFSVQYHRKFMTFYRFRESEKDSRNSRINSLFHVLNIPEEHIFRGSIDDVDKPVLWEDVDVNLSRLRDESMQFLYSALQ